MVSNRIVDYKHDPIVSELSEMYRSNEKELNRLKKQVSEIDIKNKDINHITAKEYLDNIKLKEELQNEIVKLKTMSQCYFDAREIVMNNLKYYQYIDDTLKM